MIGVEFLKGQGLGNRLFCYISAKCIAEDLGVPFGTAGREYLGADFLDMDLGEEITDVSGFSRYDEKEERIYLRDSVHDAVHGCYIAGVDPVLAAKLSNCAEQDNIMLYGNLQSEEYFGRHKEEIRQWLRVKPAFDSAEYAAYTADDLCILNVRGGEYADKNELFLEKKYWKDAMEIMRGVNRSMRFMIVTDDVDAASRLLPGIEVHHFGAAGDYCAIRNARYLIVSNSSFAFFPAYTSTVLRRIIAPKYWARHNVSDGYWASEQNIYDGFEYLGKDGKLYDAADCRAELSEYKRIKLPEKQALMPLEAGSREALALGKKYERERLLKKAVAKLGRTFAK